MNQFFYESRGKEKVKDLLNEGRRSQAFHKSGAQKISLMSRAPKLVLIVLGILGMLSLFLR